jgi:phosphatidate cytidylyltransferase
MVSQDRGAQVAPTPPSAAPGSDLRKRLMSGLVMAVLALGAAWLGGAIFLAFWAVAAALILWEWVNLTAGASQRGVWVLAGVLYAGAAFAAPVVLRGDAQLGFVAIIFLFAVVWSTDILGYLVGRFVGGPKLWPAVSPKKTWSGALGGTAGALIAAGIIAQLNALTIWPVALLAAVLSVGAQAGDLFESAIKRRFNAKDASHLIPGHGGVMDRLDGFIVAALIAALVGLARGGLMSPGRGVLAW